MATASKSIVRKMIPGILFGFIVLLALAFVGDLKQVGRMILDFKWSIFPFVLLLTLVNYVLRFFKWHYYLKLVGIRTIGWRESARLFVGGFPLAVTPGKVGEALKGVWLNQRSGLPIGKGVSVVVAERISDGLAVLGLSTLGVLAYPQYWPAFTLILGILITVIIISQIPAAAEGLLNLAEKIPLIKKVVPGLREFYDGSISLFRPVPTIAAVSLGAVSWLGEGIGFYLILLGLGIAPGIDIAAKAVFILAFSTVVGAASALPGGIGAAEISIAGMLTLLAGIDPAVASTATLLIRLATLWFGVLLGLTVWIFSPDLIGIREKNGKEA